jgi:hypothetical protein
MGEGVVVERNLITFTTTEDILGTAKSIHEIQKFLTMLILEKEFYWMTES